MPARGGAGRPLKPSFKMVSNEIAVASPKLSVPPMADVAPCPSRKRTQGALAGLHNAAVVKYSAASASAASL